MGKHLLSSAFVQLSSENVGFFFFFLDDGKSITTMLHSFGCEMFL